VAAEHFRARPEWLERHRDPAGSALGLDLQHVGIIDPRSQSGERRYRVDQSAPPLPGDRTGRFAVISLDILCHGARRNRLWVNPGTGLSKSSVAEATNEAIHVGILVRKKCSTEAGRSISSLYAIDWDRVQQFDWERRKGLRQMSKPRAAVGG
jgi:hypothetical protein